RLRATVIRGAVGTVGGACGLGAGVRAGVNWIGCATGEEEEGDGCGADSRALQGIRFGLPERQRLRRLRRCGGGVLGHGVARDGRFGLLHDRQAPEFNSFLRLALMVLRASCTAWIALLSRPARARPIKSSASAPRPTSVGAAFSVR